MAYVIQDVRLDDLTLPSGLKIDNQWNNPLVALYRVSYMFLWSIWGSPLPKTSEQTAVSWFDVVGNWNTCTLIITGSIY